MGGARPRLNTHLLRQIYAAPDAWWAALKGGGLMRYEPSNLPEAATHDLVVAGNVLLVGMHKGLRVSYDRGRTREHIGGHLAESSFPVLATGGVASRVLAGSSTEGLYAMEFSAAAVASAEARAANRLAGRPPQK